MLRYEPACLSESADRSHRCSPLFTALVATLAKAAHGAVLHGRVAWLSRCAGVGACAHANQYAVTSVPRARQLLAGRPELVNVLPPFWSFADRTGTAKIQGTARRGWGFFGFGFGVYPKSQ